MQTRRQGQGAAEMPMIEAGDQEDEKECKEEVRDEAKVAGDKKDAVVGVKEAEELDQKV
jgi:hypothetical protein